MHNKLAINSLLLLIAIIWGFGFVPQRYGMEYLEPAAFNSLRFAFGALTLLPVMWLMRSSSSLTVSSMVTHRSTMLLGVLLGLIVFAGALCQQISIKHTSLANVAFITGLYAIMVPVLGLAIGLRYQWVVWFGGVVALIGLFLMTNPAASISLKGDTIALIGAFFWALHLLLLALKAGKHNQVLLAFYQFLFCAIFSAIAAFIFEGGFPNLYNAQLLLWPILNGVIVVGIGYTLQVLIMDKADPFAASLILSLESVFGALAGYWFFSEILGLPALVGAFLMLLGCLLAQWPSRLNKHLS